MSHSHSSLVPPPPRLIRQIGYYKSNEEFTKPEEPLNFEAIEGHEISLHSDTRKSQATSPLGFRETRYVRDLLEKGEVYSVEKSSRIRGKKNNNLK